MGTFPNRSITVVTATPLETKAVRRAAPGFRCVEAGIGLAKVRGDDLGEIVVSCGLAGGLRPDLPTGTVVVPGEVVTTSGERIICDRELTNALAAAARLVAHVECGPLLTSPTLIAGAARSEWARRGCVAVDMETGFIRARRLAAIRVILDTPERELSDAWLRPARALLRPRAWTQALWLAREGPRCAKLAAQVLAAAFSLT